MFNHKLPSDFPMQTLRKKTSPCKYKNDPGRFLGEGVSFRAKLIGVLEVPEARGDRMCQEALADLKMAIRAAGEHKQRIQVHVAIDGLRLRDDKTGDSLYHHPVHKISFIAQDMSDSRAFGYIFGSPDTGHRFFGIKTDKAASQVVIAMRDLFQVVFELKKKEIEMAKQHLESKNSAGSTTGRHNASVTAELTKLKINTSEPSSSASKPSESGAEGGVAELVDLEQELSSLRRGLTLVEGLTPSSDPFGDSFIIPSQTGLLPPPPVSSSRGRSTARAASPGQASNTPLSFDLASVQSEPPDNAESTSLVDNSESSVSQISCKPPNSLSYDVFTELDPLGTGRSKPYVDKKLFFQELKNPPKKVLKDLVPTTTTTNLLSDILPTFTSTTTVETMMGEQTTITSLPRQSGGSVSIAKSSNYSNNCLFSSDPFEETDPFDSADPFSDTFKEDPFVSNLQEFPKPVFSEEFKSRMRDKVEGGKNMFNGCLQVSLPPEPTPKSPRLQRQTTDTSSIRQRPQPSSKLNSESASPPPPLPPKKMIEVSTNRPPPRPPYEQHEQHTDSGAESGPPLPRPARRREPAMADRSAKPRLSSGATNSSEDEYLSPIPPPLPGGRRFDITLSQLLTCSMDELAQRLRVPASNLSSMTLPQLTTYLRSYLAADSERANIHIEPATESEKEQIPVTPPVIPKVTPEYKARPAPVTKTYKTNKLDFKSNFEDDFASTNETSEIFEANFDDFDKKANPSYDRYAAFREIQELELTTKSILDPLNDDDQQQNGDFDNREDSDEKEESPVSNLDIKETKDLEKERDSHSPLKSLDELTLDSFNMFRNSVSPKPTLPMEAKIEDIKTVMKNLQLEQARRSVSPRDAGTVNVENSKLEEKASDKYAALRDIITITEPQDEFESLPPEIPKERKRSDEKSDGFDNSDFFDCIDNSSLSFSHVEDAFRKSPLVREEDSFRKSPLVREEDSFRKSPLVREEEAFRKSPLVREEETFRKSPVVREKLAIELKKEEKQDLSPRVECLRELQPPARLSTGSMSEIASGSSPETKERRSGGRWSVLRAPGSSDSKDSEPAPPRPRRNHHRCRERHTSSSSRDASPWEEEPPPTRPHRGHSHNRDSRHNSSGSRECLDSGSGKDKIRDKRDIRERDRDSRDSGSTRERDRRDSGSGRDRDIRPREISKDRDPRDRRDRRSRDRDKDWDRDRDYSRERDYRDSRSRERLSKEYRDKDRDRHRKAHHSWDDDEEYSDGCGSGRSSPRERWSDYRWRREERNYGSLGWRETRRRSELRQSEDNSDRRYGATLSWSGRRGGAPPRAHERRRRHERRHTREHDAHKRPPYSELEATRFAFELDDSTASPLPVGCRTREPDSPATRFRFDSDSVSPRSMFEDDFTAVTTPRTRAASIAEEEENDLPPLRAKQSTHRDIKKSESVNIFVRESDPFEGDDFFACTGSDRAARRDNWPGNFQAFDNV